jgi:alkylation response protein AidB-like acyl-CoA dehydrogenase
MMRRDCRTCRPAAGRRRRRRGNGYTRDYPVERWHRDAKIFTIFEDTSEIEHLLIGRAVTGPDVREPDLRIDLGVR